MLFSHIYIEISLSIYLSTFIDLCLSFYKTFMFICIQNKLIISYAYLDDPGYKFRQSYVNNGKRKTKYDVFIILYGFLSTFLLILALISSECHAMVIANLINPIRI